MIPALRPRPRLAPAAPGRIALLVLALLLAAALSFGVSAAPATIANQQVTIEDVGSIGGGIPVVAFAGSYAYVGEGTGLTVLDISNPERLVRIAHLRLADQQYTLDPSAIQLVGSRLYIGGGHQVGFAIVDVSDPAHPAQLGRYGGIKATAMAVEGSRAYLLEGEQLSSFDQPRLHALDISDPAHPALLWTWMLMSEPGIPSRGTTLFAAGGRAYITDTQHGLTIFDVQSASGPTLLGTYAAAGIRGIAVAGDRAYVAASGAGIQVFDIHDPAHLALLGSYDAPADTYSATGVRLEGSRAYVAATYTGFTGVQVLDISDPANPMLLGSLNSGQNMQPMQAAGGWVSVFSASAWLLVDWRTAAHPMPYGRYPVIAYAEDIQVQAGRAYIASEYDGGLQIVDVSTPDSLMQIGSYSQIYASSLEVRGNLAYVTDPVANGGLHIVDISTVTNTVQLGRYDSFSVGAALCRTACHHPGDCAARCPTYDRESKSLSERL